MASKLRGSRLEAEIDKFRGECDWFRLSGHLQAIRSKRSGVEKLAHLIEGELCLEMFLEKHSGENYSLRISYICNLVNRQSYAFLIYEIVFLERLQPRIQQKDFLRKAEGELRNAITDNPEEQTIVMEAYLLLSKLYYFCASFNEALSSIEKSKLDKATTQFTSLRSLKLAAEGYAIKGESSYESIIQVIIPVSRLVNRANVAKR